MKHKPLRGSTDTVFASLSHRIVAGLSDRPTRFHDERGNLVPLNSMLYAPHAFISTALKLCIHYRPPVPWISYRARNAIDRLIQPSWSVLEFGSGMSTIWFARRASWVNSIEHDGTWFGLVQASLKKRGIANVRHLLREIETYSDLSMFPDCSFDFVLIDGIVRTECANKVVPKVKKGGWLYLDNTDQNSKRTPDGDFQEAEKVLLRAASLTHGKVCYFTDFAPTSFVVSQGLLVQLQS